MTQRKGLTAVTWLILLALAATANGAPQAGKSAGQGDADQIEVRQYRLTMDKIEKLAATYQAIYKLMESNPEFRKESDDSPTITEKAKYFDTKYPQGTALIHRNGLTTREYIVASIGLFSGLALVGMKKQGSLKAYPADTITPENAAFVEQNYDKLTALSKKMIPPEN